MSVKLRVLAEMDAEYAKELKQFFSSQNMDDYLDLTVNDFVKLCEAKLGEYSNQIMEALQNRERGRISNI